MSFKSCLFVLIVCSFYCLKTVSAFVYEDCGSVEGRYSNVSMTFCMDAANLPYCPMKKGSEGTLEIHFLSAEDTSTLTAVVHGTIAGITFPVHLPNKNACLNSNVECPVKEFQDYTYRSTLPILKSYVKVAVGIQWALQNDDGENVVCIKFPAKIVD